MSKPILFNSEMIRAVLDGRKTQTRRIMNKKFLVKMKAAALFGEVSDFVGNGELRPNDESYILDFCPYGRVGDELWVRETHYLYGHWVKNGFTKTGKQAYKFVANKTYGAKYCDNAPHKIKGCLSLCTKKDETGWFKRPSIFMPRWASRVTLEITNIRVERVQEISEPDSQAEGVDADYVCGQTYRFKFAELWDSINAKRGYGWDTSPWVWVVEFRRIDK